MPMSPRMNAPSASAAKRVLVVDDHPVVRHGLVQLINKQPGLTVCGEAEDPDEALRLAEKLQPDLMITDLTLKGGSGLELIKAVHERLPETKILVASIHDEDLYADRVLQAGAVGYINKQQSVTKMVEAVRKVLDGRIALSDDMMRVILNRAVGTNPDAETTPISRLSNRELQVFELLGQGMTTRQIADRMGVRPKTVETYRENIKGKLNLKNANELLRHAVQWTLENS